MKLVDPTMFEVFIIIGFQWIGVHFVKVLYPLYNNAKNVRLGFSIFKDGASESRYLDEDVRVSFSLIVHIRISQFRPSLADRKED